MGFNEILVYKIESWWLGSDLEVVFLLLLFLLSQMKETIEVTYDMINIESFMN